MTFRAFNGVNNGAHADVTPGSLMNIVNIPRENCESSFEEKKENSAYFQVALGNGDVAMGMSRGAYKEGRGWNAETPC